MMCFEELIEQSRKGDKKAMIRLYGLVSKPVFNTCMRMMSNTMDAEEIMQDSLLKAFEKMKFFKGNADSFVSFVKKIAINRCIDIHRKNKNNPLLADMNDNVSYIQEADDFEFDDDFSVSLLMASMEKLPPGYKMILNLHLIEDIDFNDIATMLNVKPSTVRSQYVRAKTKLCEMLKNEMSYENR